MPLYEVMLVGGGKPELRFTDHALGVGELVEIGNRAWRVESTSEASQEDAELRFVLILEGARAARGEAQQARRQARALKTEVANTRDKSGVLRDAARRVQAERARRDKEGDV